ncbi:MAG TPA: AI-2E family transporter [Sedimentisphaerales bacterium]|nr:AI-2E family transporter [Sedimentisphaerales bacterium]
MMSDRRDESTWLITGSLVVLAAAAVAAALLYTRAVMIPFVLAVFTVSLVSPILDFQVIRLKFPRPLAAAVTFLVVIVIIALVCLLITLAVQMVISTASRYSNDFANLAKEVFLQVDRWGVKLNQDKIVNDLRDKIPNLVTDAVGRVLGVLSRAFLILIFVVFLLAGRNPHAVRSGVYADIDSNIRRYIATKVVISIVTGLLVWGVLKVVGLELAGVFGMLSFLLNFIPSIGSIIATLLPIPIAVAQFQNPWLIIYVVAVPGAIQISIGNFIEPKLMGKGLNLHPVTILLALSFWGLLWGIGGMFLAAPMTAVIRIVLMQFDTLRPLGKLLAGELPSWKTHPSQSDGAPKQKG